MDNTTHADKRARLNKTDQYRIGLEIEGIFVPPYKIMAQTHTERAEHLACSLASYHNSKTHEDSTIARMRVQPGFGDPVNSPDDESNDYTLWDIKLESTILPISATECGLEIVSPILSFDDSGAWRTHVSTVFDLFNEQCRIKPNENCGFHVHLSLADRVWQLDELKQICIAILHFDQAFIGLLPARRRKSRYCKSNYHNSAMKKLTPDER
ncbi:hypothetical protein CONLIGDRAFT_675288 [Coniochaeta ligniaria NRRL 30616]|uniref:Amidoligase enzyme n=1 Tax=Coniochaeta ligniaria NRRL 30616 TaxID=1408157 RepID=A0A1J7JXZ0_9PEZI|nr:hypothetical protein CONLIGDRAFT_675288 [Coniochaeta ligniaria NRRL 30616]